MSGDEAVCALLDWAARPVGWPPVGTLTIPSSLARPTEEVVKRLRWLAGASAARLGAGCPPFGDPTPLGIDAILLAAALAVRTETPLAEQLVAIVEPQRLGDGTEDGPGRGDHGWSEAVGRHGVVAAALHASAGADSEVPGVPVGAGLIEAMLEVSPLTRLLCRPPRRRLAEATVTSDVDAAVRLMRRPRGRGVLVTAMATPCLDATMLTWRYQLLSRLVASHTDVVIDVYLAARLRHGVSWDELLRAAITEASRYGGATERAVALLNSWVPLALIDRADPLLLRARPLLEGCRPVLAAVSRLGLITRQGG